MEKIVQTKVLRKSLIFIIVSFIAMVFYELIKQVIFPKITLWESHFITIVFVSLIGFCFSFLYFKNIKLIQQYKEDMNKNVSSQMN